jgi:hypothetical protein
MQPRLATMPLQAALKGPLKGLQRDVKFSPNLVQAKLITPKSLSRLSSEGFEYLRKPQLVKLDGALWLI